MYLCLELKVLLLLPQVLLELLPGWARLMDSLLLLTGARAAPRHYVLGAAGHWGELILYDETNASGPSRIICPLVNDGLRGGGT